MNRKLKHGMSMAVAILSALFINSACTEEWDDHYNDNGTNSSKTSLLDKIRQDSDLTDFCEVLDSMNVPSYKDGNWTVFNFADSLLNQSRVYTLWAPVNGSFDKDSLLAELKAEPFEDILAMKKLGRDDVFARFVGSHVAEFLKPASDTLKEDNNILLINEKLVPFVGGSDESLAYSFNGLNVVEKNIRVSNGIIHKISGSVTYLPNIWEYIKTAEGTDSVAKFLYSFNKREFNEYLSIEGPTVNGDKTYIDSVFTNSNQWLSYGYNDKTAGFGDISHEDSSYVVFVPSNDMWNEMVPKIETFFNYHTGKENFVEDSISNDSLKKFYARKTLVNHMVFSNNDQLTPGDGHTALVVDSMRSTYRAGERRILFAKNDLMEGVIRTQELSNGTFHLKNNFNYNPHDMWYDTIIVQAENFAYQGTTFLKEEDDAASFTDGVLKGDEGVTYMYVEKGNLYHTIDSANRTKNLVYVHADKNTNTRPSSLKWTIPNVLSGDYYVGAVIVPKFIDQTEAVDSSVHTSALPNLFSLSLYANVEKDGTTAKKGSVKVIEETEELENDPTRIDTIWISEKDDKSKRLKVHIPYCEYGLTNQEFSVYVKLECMLKNKDQLNFYDPALRVDLIILEPVKDEE